MNHLKDNNTWKVTYFSVPCGPINYTTYSCDIVIEQNKCSDIWFYEPQKQVARCKKFEKLWRAYFQVQGVESYESPSGAISMILQTH